MPTNELPVATGSRAGSSTPAVSDRMYIFVRRDLPHAVRAVQATHAAVAWMLRTPPAQRDAWPDEGPSIVLYGVSDEHELHSWLAVLGSRATPFCEPDLANALTALAYVGSARDDFRTLRLL